MKKILLGIFIVFVLGIIIGSFKQPINNFIQYDENLTLALYNENGEKIDQIPSKDSGYTLDTEKSSCTYGSVSWDRDSWGPVVKVNNEVNGRVGCNLYFRKVTPYDECVYEYGSDSVQCEILKDYSDSDCPEVNEDGTILVNKIEDENGYLCSASDNYGMSYYYRGNVVDNYVSFAGYYWRILRINGYGSLRLIYDGTNIHSNGEKSEDRQIGTSRYNQYWKNNNVDAGTNSQIYLDNAGIGYMYGNRDGLVTLSGDEYNTSSKLTKTNTYYFADSYNYNDTIDRFSLVNPVGILGSNITASNVVGKYTCRSTTSSGQCQILNHITNVEINTNEVVIYYKVVSYGTTSKEKAQTNTNDSTVKEYLDSWYKTNILDKGYDSYINDTLFCNDRSLSVSKPNGYTQLGYGVEKTTYRAYSSSRITLDCAQQNDRFTVDDETIGNGNLIYPIGLVTSDEINLAGAYSRTNNTNYYLYSGTTYWTMTPVFFYDYVADNYVSFSDGYLASGAGVIYEYGIRPVINLKPNSLKSGDGTASNPYKV